MALTWTIISAGPTSATGAFVGHGTDNVSYILAYPPPGSGTVIYTFPDPLELWIGGFPSGTLTQASDLPEGWAPDSAYEYDPQINAIGNTNPSDSLRHEFSPLGIDFTQTVYSGGSGPVQSLSGMTMELLLACAGETALLTGNSPSGINGQVACYASVRLSGTYTITRHLRLPPIPTRTPATQGGDKARRRG